VEFRGPIQPSDLYYLQARGEILDSTMHAKPRTAQEILDAAAEPDLDDLLRYHLFGEPLPPGRKPPPKRLRKRLRRMMYGHP
jgi:hypothetical protein